MKLNKKLKKGFTLVELVVVIAVIAILATVSISTYSGVKNKANTSNDQSIVSQVNLSLTTVDQDKPKTMEDARQAILEDGVDIGKISSKTKNTEYAWDSVNNRFVIVATDAISLDKETVSVTYPSEYKYAENRKFEDFFVVADDIEDLETKFSHYLNKNTVWASELTITSGLDVGEVTTITNINYNREEATTAKDVVIRTNSFETIIKVNGPSDIVKHYGYAAIVNVEEIKSASYHEYGTVARLYIQKGHGVVEDDAVVVCLMDKDGDGTVATTNITSNAKVVHDATSETADAEFKAENEQYDSSTQKNAYGTTDNCGTIKDCGAGNHSYGEKIFVDSNHIYEVCSCCGYTLVTVEDSLGNQIKQTLNTVVNDKLVEKVSPVSTYETTNTITSNKDIADNYAIGEVISEPETIKSEVKDTACDHNFIGVVTTESTCTHTGIKTYTCSECGSSYTMSLPLGRHHYVVKENNKTKEVCKDCGVEKSINVCKIGDTEYKTIPLAVEYLTDHSITTKTTITLIDDETLAYNKGIEIPDGYNVVIDLNGYTIGSDTEGAWTSALVTNYGTLTIQDSTDKTKDGTGTGIITSYAEAPDQNAVPGYASNTILNRGGTLYILSGTVECNTSASGAYAIDNSNNSFGDTYCYIRGGKVIASATAIRNASWCGTSEDYLEITNATTGFIWQYESSANCKATIKISNSTIDGGLKFGYCGDSNLTSMSVKNSKIIGDAIVSQKYLSVVFEDNTIDGYLVEKATGYCDDINNTYDMHCVGFYKAYAIIDTAEQSKMGYISQAWPNGKDFTWTASFSLENKKVYVNDGWAGYTVEDLTNLIDSKYIHISGNTLTVDYEGFSSNFLNIIITD